MMQYLLAVCVPTYNRSSFLEDLLCVVAPICSKYNVEICISDNNSPDDTQAVVGKYIKLYPNIAYYKQLTNIGADDNFEYVLKMAHSKYRWLMADTCYIDEESLIQTLEDLKTADLDALIVNGAENRARYLPEKEQVYNDSRELMRTIGWHLTWISCLIYKDDLVNSTNFTRFRHSSFNQTGIVFETLANRPCNVKFNPQIIVEAFKMEKESGWQDMVFKIFCQDWYLFVMSLPIFYSFDDKTKCIKDSSRKAVVLSLRMHAKRRSQNKWNLKSFFQYHYFIRQTLPNTWIIFLIGLVPAIIWKYIFLIGKKLKQKLKIVSTLMYFFIIIYGWKR
ncbi:MAG: glycosyltransferase [Paludibacter sp.]